MRKPGIIVSRCMRTTISPDNDLVRQTQSFTGIQEKRRSSGKPSSCSFSVKTGGNGRKSTGYADNSSPEAAIAFNFSAFLFAHIKRVHAEGNEQQQEAHSQHGEPTPA